MKKTVSIITSLLLMAAQPITAIAVEDNIIWKGMLNTSEPISVDTDNGVTFLFDDIVTEEDIDVNYELGNIESSAFGELHYIDFKKEQIFNNPVNLRIPYESTDGTKVYIFIGDSDYSYNTVDVCEVTDNYFEFETTHFRRYVYSETDVVSVRQAIGELKQDHFDKTDESILPIGRRVKRVEAAPLLIFIFVLSVLLLVIFRAAFRAMRRLIEKR